MTATPATSNAVQAPHVRLRRRRNAQRTPRRCRRRRQRDIVRTRSFPTTLTVCGATLAWIGEFGDLARIWVEGTGSYGAGLSRQLAKAGVTILEVDLPTGHAATISTRSMQPAAHWTGNAPASRKSKDGAVDALLVLHFTRAHAVRERRSAVQILQVSIVPAPRNLVTRSTT